MKVALFGGTFDPIHKGHVNAALEVIRLGLVQEVWFAPVYWHRFKQNPRISHIEYRKKMIELSIQGNAALKLVDLDGNPTTTLETIRKAKAMFPKQEFFWLMGSNLVPEFDSWFKAEEILKETKLIVFPVPDCKGGRSRLISGANSVFVKYAKKIDLSSTIVRDRIRAGKKISELVDKKVEEFIKEKHLYGKQKT